MGEFELIFFGGFAAFIAYKLWSVLGKTNGDEKSRAAEMSVSVEKQAVAKKKSIEIKPVESKVVQLFEEELPEEFDKDIKAIKKIDPTFTLQSFLKGAEGAFEAVLAAYSNSKQNQLKFLLSDEIYSDFAADLEAYEAKGKSPKVTLVSIEKPEIAEVEIKGKTAQIDVKFMSEQINFVEDAGGEVIEGSKSRIERVQDIWVFERDLASSKPKWLVVGTNA